MRHLSKRFLALAVLVVVVACAPSRANAQCENYCYSVATAYEAACNSRANGRSNCSTDENQGNWAVAYRRCMDNCRDGRGGTITAGPPINPGRPGPGGGGPGGGRGGVGVGSAPGVDPKAEPDGDTCVAAAAMVPSQRKRLAGSLADWFRSTFDEPPGAPRAAGSQQVWSDAWRANNPVTPATPGSVPTERFVNPPISVAERHATMLKTFMQESRAADAQAAFNAPGRWGTQWEMWGTWGGALGSAARMASGVFSGVAVTFAGTNLYMDLRDNVSGPDAALNVVNNLYPAIPADNAILREECLAGRMK